MSFELILGGARSGKSAYAEQRIAQLLTQQDSAFVRKCYVATSLAFDDEMTQRIAHHQKQRGNDWAEYESPLMLAKQLSEFTSQDIVLVDCLTLWLNNLIYDKGESCDDQWLQHCIAELISQLEQSPAHIVLVSNEVGMGIVPLGKVTRLFVDNAGRMNQNIAAQASRVVFVAAGLPMTLKQDEAEYGH
ncbi:bifunctional adenosylcobinamide kinase/adenosylcobinamide-phosphate guanylyltransferase [Vibrio sp. ZSDZ34]|jgi:adenosylcobinamide kinase/adenosylcobinamide-phosphate guanylyltransferase|uniref:Bifunctional adenosylcobalamin biosynthesis protein n=1 Tax=Vibrio gelatinilyticus TaxID=2893468 RepID=A0A9X1W6N1_9VIBR|nr:bifunctional adenosylcobinamide kinase/adenosylcobinamide-phosphate guanylyltransferase [Vibrio gelatinilyticus]MCJ2375217.1 bifunctional adenosylcobinamide kinase/adenosylcobinamide-phosphate guanylyltransferase [Vibrio gelatinilyticus]